MTQIIDRAGRAQEVNLSIDDYRIAFEKGLSFPQYLAQKFDTDHEKYGTPFEQALASNGMFLNSDKHTGIRPPSLKAVLEGGIDINMGAVVRPDGSNAQTLTGRLLFPAVVLEMIASQIDDDNSTYEGIFNRMIATTISVDSPRVDQPIINLTAPRSVRSQPIAQFAEPPAMVTISLAEKSIRLKTVALGFEWSVESEKASTLDLVGIALREQAMAERAAIIDEAIQKMVNGDVDLGMSALPSELVTAYDSSINANSTITRKAWLKWLRKDWKKLNIDWIICDIDTYLVIEPVVQYIQGSRQEVLNSMPIAANPGIPDSINFFIVDPSLLGANVMVGLDSTRAIRKAVYTGASYSAIEEFVLRKSKALRIDFSVDYFRLFDQAWRKMTLTTS